MHVNDDDLPICLLLVKKCHHAKHLDLFDLAGIANQLADFAHVEWIIITLGLCFGVNDIWVFPRLGDQRQQQVWCRILAEDRTRGNAP